MSFISFLLTSPLIGEPIIDVTAEGLKTLTNQVSNLTTVFQAIGGFILAYIIFNIISIVLNMKKNRELAQMRILLERINRKLGK